MRSSTSNGPSSARQPWRASLLRHVNHYGPGTGFDLDGDLVKLVRKRRFPIVGNGAGVWSFIHVDDLAQATIAAVECGKPGVYNIVDDEPAPVAAWLPELARAVGAKPPRHVPVWLGKLASGDVGGAMMTQIRGTSNAKAKREFGWQPHYKSWRDGFRTGLGEITPPGSDRTHLQRRPRRLTGARRVRKLVRGSLERSSR